LFVRFVFADAEGGAMLSVDRFLRIATAAGIAVLSVSEMVALQQPTSGRWITAWGTSQQALGMTVVTNATVRMIARVTIPGEAVRIRIDNTFGTIPLVIGKTFVGQRIQGAALAAGSNRQVMFQEAATITVPPGGSVTSDPVAIHVLAQQDLAVSLYIPGMDVRPSQHTSAQVTSYATANGLGDATADEMATRFTVTTTATYWVKAIDVSSSSSTGSIVAFGDSITDGTCSTLDAHDRWEDVLAVRLMLDAAGRGRDGANRAIVNEGIGGNTITREKLQPPPDSPPGLERLDRDVLTHHGVTHVILFMGTNDVRREAPAAQVIAGSQEIIKRVKARDLTILGVTMIPRHNRPAAENNTGWNAAKTGFRNDVNQWMRTKMPFDAVIDFDKVVQDSKNGDLISPPFNCGDGIHPSPRGYYEMGTSVRLDLFK
jgi:lysophospholipase L1-like esterase